MKALISPQENNRICAVVSTEFQVASPLHWVDCPAQVTTEWAYDGEGFSVPAAAQPSLTEQFELVRHALQAAIDTKAQELGFSSGNALMLYVGFTNPFQSLAQQFAPWEASVWSGAETYKQEVIAGISPMLTPMQAVGMMPEYPS